MVERYRPPSRDTSVSFRAHRVRSLRQRIRYSGRADTPPVATAHTNSFGESQPTVYPNGGVIVFRRRRAKRDQQRNRQQFSAVVTTSNVGCVVQVGRTAESVGRVESVDPRGTFGTNDIGCRSASPGFESPRTHSSRTRRSCRSLWVGGSRCAEHDTDWSITTSRSGVSFECFSRQDVDTTGRR